MLEKEVLENGMVRVTFHVSEQVWTECIALLGEFNNWDAEAHRMCQSHGDHSWHISIDLEPNRSYRFRYLLDDVEWMDDDHADGYEANAFGGVDSVVRT